MSWPTELKADDSAPTLMELLGSGDVALARQAAYLAQAGARMKVAGHQLEGFQLPLVGNGVRRTVPMVLADRRGNKAAVFTQAEAWTEERIGRLRVWIADVRKAGLAARVPVIVVSQYDSPEVAAMAEVGQFISLACSLPGGEGMSEVSNQSTDNRQGGPGQPLMATPETAVQIAQEAVDFIRAKSGVTLPYTPASLPAIDAMVDKIKATGATEQDAAGLLLALGCFVGEVFVRNAGGRWRRTEDVGMSKVCSFPIVVELPSGSGCNPIGKVFKRFRSGPGDHIAFFYASTLKLLSEPHSK